MCAFNKNMLFISENVSSVNLIMSLNVGIIYKPRYTGYIGVFSK